MSWNKMIILRTPNIDGKTEKITEFPVPCAAVNGRIYIKGAPDRLIIARVNDWKDADELVNRIENFQNGNKSIYSLLSVVVDDFSVYNGWNRPIVTGNPQVALYDMDGKGPIYIDSPLMHRLYQYMGEKDYCLFWNSGRIYWANRGWQVEDWPRVVNSYFNNELNIWPYVITLGRIEELEKEPVYTDIINDIKKGDNITDYVVGRWGKKK